MSETIIVMVGAEGGSVTLLGRQGKDQKWQFRSVTADSSWAMLDEEDGGGQQSSSAPDPVWVTTWSEAMALLDRYPWASLTPLVVHADFQEDVLVEVTRRLTDSPSARRAERMNRWLMVCGGS